MQCLKWFEEQTVEHMGNGGCACDTAEETHANTLVNIGIRTCLVIYQDTKQVFDEFKMLEPLEVPEDAT
jgi:hypothetical protein